MLSIPDPWEEVIYISELGKVIDFPCQHPERIPGLDASGCPVCKVWWVNLTYRQSKK
jgi:hypothetical protein